MFCKWIYALHHFGTRVVILPAALGLILVMAVCGCGRNGADDGVDALEPHAPQAEASVENDGGNNGTSRVFVKVVLAADDHIVLEDANGISYWVDSKYDAGFSKGDLLCLVFRDKEELENGFFRVEPLELYPNDNRTDIPAA